MKISKLTFKNRIIAMTLIFAIILSLVPNYVFTTVESAEPKAEYGKASIISNIGTIKQNETENINISASDDIVWSKSDSKIGKKSDGWWIGIKISAPASYNEDVLKNAKYQEYIAEGWVEAESFWDNKNNDEGTPYINLWTSVDETMLNEAKLSNNKTLTYKWRFSWDGDCENDNDFEQTVTLTLDTSNISLIKDDITVYPVTDSSLGTVSSINPTKAEIQDNQSNITKVSYYNNTVINWNENHQWKFGINVTSPQKMDKETAKKASYQVKNENIWSGSKNLWDNQSSDKKNENSIERYINLWCDITPDILENALKNDDVIYYNWRFDWNSDGTYEQQIVMTINPERITLLNDNIQVYPQSGTATALTENPDISGNNTNNIEIRYNDKLELNMQPADSSKRDKNGWWVKVKVTAPNDISSERIKNVKYGIYNPSENSYKDGKSFYEDKSSSDEDETQNIELLAYINNETVNKAKASNTDILYMWHFDWNNDGTYEQNISVTINPNNIILKKAEQAQIEFADKNPNAISFSQKDYSNTASGGTVKGNIEYESSDKSVASVDSNGKLTPVSAGEVTIKATLKGDEFYNDSVASYSITIQPVNQPDELKFSKDMNDIEITYGEYGENGNKKFENIASGGTGSGQITYKSDNEEVVKANSDGSVDIYKAGDATITATKEAAGPYNAQEKSYKLIIKKSDQKIEFENNTDSTITVTYGDSYQNKASAKTNITYSSSDQSVAEIDENGNLTTKKAGKTIITATATEDDCYNGASLSYDVQVEHAGQTVSFNKGFKPKVKFNDNENNFVNTASSDKNLSSFEYSIVSGEEYIKDKKIDSKTGEFEICGAGTIVIKAIVEGNEYYKESEAVYTLTVEKSNQEISFDNDKYTFTTGQTVEQPIKASEISTYSGTGEITYSIKSDENKIIDSLNKKTGEITLTNNPGKAVIVATKAGDSNYNEASDEYTLEVNEWIPESSKETYYTVIGETKNNSGWFTGNVSVQAKEGYLLSDNKTDWKDTLENVVIDDTKGKTISFYIKRKEDGYISELCSEIIKKDTVSPETLIKNGELSSWEKFLTIITFGTYQSETAKFTVESTNSNSPEDITSGVATIEYFIQEHNNSNDVTIKDKSDLDNITDWIKCNGEITVEKNKVFVIYVKVTDTAGNYVYTSTNGVVFDAEPPKITVETTSEPSSSGWYNKDIELKVKVSDQAPYSGIKSINYRILCDGEETSNGNLFTYNNDNPNYSGLVNSWESDKNIIIDSAVNNSDNVKLIITAIDNAGNSTEENYTYTYKISSMPPEILVEYEDDPNYINEYKGTKYYNQKRKAKITIKNRESLFNKDNVNISVTAKNYFDEIIENTYTLGKEWKHNANAENKDYDTFTNYIYFNGNANYSFNVGYADNANNEAKKYTSEIFAVDLDSPSGTAYTDKSSWSKFIETITFGLWKNDSVTVSAEAADETSPIKSLQYFISEDNISKENLKNVEWKDYTNNITISDDMRFVVYFKATDYANHTEYFNTNGFIVDKGDSNISISAETQPNNNGYYNDDVKLNIFADDNLKNRNSYSGSGIKTVEYWIETDGKETVRKKLFDFDYKESAEASYPGEKGNLKITDYSSGKKEQSEYNDIPLTKDYLRSEWNGSIIVDKEKNNSDNVRIYVKVTDNAGNESYYKDENSGNNYFSLKIASTAPKINISYDPKEVINEVDGRGYLNTKRTATVTITDRTTVFNSDNATKGIKIIALNAKGETPKAKTDDGVYEPIKDENGNRIFDDEGRLINPDYMISSWSTAEGKTPDEATHTATISFDTDANYSFDISYTNKADKTNEDVDIADGTKSPYEFTVDKEIPDAQITYKENSWNKLIDVLTFGIWSNEDITISAFAEDVTSEALTYQYYKTDITKALSYSELDNIPENQWKTSGNNPNEFENISVNKDERLTLYLKVTDRSNNYVYVSSNGIIEDKTLEESDITLTPITKPSGKHHVKGGKDIDVYNNKDGVTVQIDVKEQEPSSGIKTVKYWVTCDGNITQPETTLFDFDISNPTYEQLVKSFNKNITVSSKLNNSCNVKVYVEVTDNAGNIKTKELPLDIDITNPTIQVEYDNNKPYKTVGNHGYFPNNRTAEIIITERNSHFNADDALKGIEITAHNNNGKQIISDTKSLISKWNTNENQSADKTTHTAKISYTTDAHYTFKISYTDTANNKCQKTDTDNQKTPYDFTVDKKAPTGTIKAGEFGTWDKLIRTLTFGLWTLKSVNISGTTKDTDDISPIESVSYYKTDKTTAMSESELKKVSGWTKFNGTTNYSGLKVYPNEQFTIYVKIVDFAGNIKYISSNGIIADNTLPVVEEVKPEITITPQQPVNGIYNSDVSVAVKVQDPKSGSTNAYSGLKEISYEVLNMGNQTQKGVLYNFGTKAPTQSELKQSWENSNAIVVNKELNNSNDVVIKVYAEDNAGNKNTASVSVKIDITKPSVNVYYDNNDGDSSFKDSVYFKNNRTAKIVITERNFDKDDVKIDVKNTDGEVPVLSEWTTTAGGSNGDSTIHTATLLYSKDGDYTFNISYTDKAGNKNTAVDYGNSLAPQQFTIDKTKPVLKIVYDNNDVKNQKYYKSERVATITIDEHNFETSRVKLSITATDNGEKIEQPVISDWTSDGNLHILKITYKSDGLYTFDLDYKDKAGNATDDIEKQEFYIDKTAPKVFISNIADKSANNNSNIGFVIKATDTNFDKFEPSLTVVEMNGNTKELDLGYYTDIENGKIYTVDNIKPDGIYTIKCTVIDKAGNAYKDVVLENKDKSTYTSNRYGNMALLTFSVNRKGSTFTIDNNTADTISKYYIQNIRNDIVIIETNTDAINKYSITLNDKILKENTDYTVSKVGGENSWYKNTYTISKSLFEAEGEYKVVVSSEDEAGNNAFSDVKKADINFVVDRTAPVVAVTGMENDGRYQTEKQLVTLIPTDDGGKLKSLKVNTVDNSGNSLKEIINLSGDDLNNALESNNGKITFEIEEGLYQNVQVICSDSAMGVDNKTNTYNNTFTNVSVSSNAFMIFWANRPVRWLSIFAIIILVLVSLTLIIRRRKFR